MLGDEVLGANEIALGQRLRENAITKHRLSQMSQGWVPLLPEPSLVLREWLGCLDCPIFLSKGP